MVDQMKALAVNLVLFGLLAMLLFGVVRRVPRTRWTWGSGVTVLFAVFFILIEPVYIVPIFNKVTRLDDPEVVDPILSLARANGIHR
jgi:STE24 endopeptidase